MAEVLDHEKEREETHEKTEKSKDEVRIEKIGGDSAINLRFRHIGIQDWLVTACESVGIIVPTPVQQHCIPPILEGKNVIGCAQTGSGKTAAFALPILQKLVKDPYGIFAVILTPTRELAIQIGEQFEIFGVSCGLRKSVIIGGVSMIGQGLELQNRPHIIICTPGRLAGHLNGPNPPFLKRCAFLVLDEADRLLTPSFESALETIVNHMPSNRQTLLFSATMNATMQELNRISSCSNFFRFDATPHATTVDTLRQEYLFIPLAIKSCYLVYLLQKLLPIAIVDGNSKDEKDLDNELKLSGKARNSVIEAQRVKKKKANKRDKRMGKEDDIDDKQWKDEWEKNQLQEDEEGNRKFVAETTARAAIIFVSTCWSCQLIAELLMEMRFNVVCLHSRIPQSRRVASLNKFKSGIAKILIATDVASRGLDIPQVELVINFDIPRDPTDYIHRVGRTARAGRGGRAISLITQYDISLVHSIEEAIQRKLVECPGVEENDVLKLLNKVTKAKKHAKMRLVDSGFEEKLAMQKHRELKQKIQKQIQSTSSGQETNQTKKRKCEDLEHDKINSKKERK